MFCFVSGRPAPSAANMPALHLLSGFRPSRVTHYLDKREIWRERVPNFTFIGAEMWEYSPQNYQIFAFWP